MYNLQQQNNEMTISIEQYRSVIGSFHGSGPKRTNNLKHHLYESKQSYSEKNRLFNNLFSIIIYCIVLTNLLSNVEAPQCSERFIVFSVSTSICKSNTYQTARLALGSCEINQPIKFHCFVRSNKLMKIINGNRSKAGFKHTQWNIDKGLFTMGKLDDIKVNLSHEKPHTFCVTEANLVRNEINAKSCNEFSTDNLLEKLAFTGYTVLLPDSWYTHGKARLFIYVSEDIKFKQLNLPNGEHHLQSIWLELSFGRSRPHIVNYFYREWTNTVTGSNLQQYSDLQYLIEGWRRSIAGIDIDFLAMGDMNLNAKTWMDPGFEHPNLAREVHNFLLAESCVQLTEQYLSLIHI